MCITRENIQYAIEKLEKTKKESTLPLWEQLPSIELYMDQVIILLNQYVSPSTPITQSMINNYVKLKVVPAPVKKRYGKIHLAYLIIFCTLKQTLSLSTIQKIMPLNLTEEQVIEVYKNFTDNRQMALEFALKKVNEFSKTDDVNNIILQTSSIANVFKTLTEDIAFEEDNKEDSKTKKV